MRKQQKRLETVEAEIEQYEKRMVAIDSLLETPEVYADHVKCQELHDEQVQLINKLETLYEEWDEMSE